MTTQVNIRLDAEIKTLFENQCKSMGLSISNVINALAYQTVQKGRIPFDITSPKDYEENYFEINKERLNKVNAKVDVKKNIIHFDSIEALKDYMGDTWE
jgi:addiction module RelB/DinJ family antitoxin